MILSLISLGGSAQAGGITIPNGASFSLGNATLTNTGGTLLIEGTLSAGTNQIRTDHLSIDTGGVLNGGSATLLVCGNWNNSGTFNAESSAVFIEDSCGVLSNVNGSNTFNNLTLESRTGKTVQIATNAGQTVNNTLVLKGVEAALLTLRSATSGQAAQLIALGGGSGEFIDVDDIDATAGTPISVDAFSIVGANAIGFLATVSAAMQIPAMPYLGLLLLLLTTVLIGMLSASSRLQFVAQFLAATDRLKRSF